MGFRDLHRRRCRPGRVRLNALTGIDGFQSYRHVISDVCRFCLNALTGIDGFQRERGFPGAGIAGMGLNALTGIDGFQRLELLKARAQARATS